MYMYEYKLTKLKNIQDWTMKERRNHSMCDQTVIQVSIPSLFTTTLSNRVKDMREIPGLQTWAVLLFGRMLDPSNPLLNTRVLQLSAQLSQRLDAATAAAQHSFHKVSSKNENPGLNPFPLFSWESDCERQKSASWLLCWEIKSALLHPAWLTAWPPSRAQPEIIKLKNGDNSSWLSVFL